ncbi:chromosomal replication initiator protein DnaA [Liberiplasma polymorphum]|jgi:chromosomal replication initiator protein|uniref:chromosomal replication initiator protein DnaA n=1 Tax=Liberiplasma polymorphum TaxID=3374570 RepID=UPI003776AFF3
MQEHVEVWNEIRSELADTFEEQSFQETIGAIDSIFKVKNNYIYLLVENEFVKKRIEMLYLTKMNRLLEGHMSDTYKYKLITKDQAEKELVAQKSYEINTPESEFGQTEFNTNLNPSYTFDNFVVGNSNRLAYTSAIKVADQPGIVANPLYIFGDVGLGKTHLMQCVGNYILEGDIHKKVLYVKADQFVEEYVRLASKKKFDEFNDQYRDVDVLLVDDIQFLAKKEKSQIEFFKLFEILHSHQKQIVITSDRSASDLKDIMSRLTSRFLWGVSVDINRPDLDHRIKILEKKLMAETSDKNLIPTKVLEYIASVFDNNVRELEGALKRVLFYCTAFNFEFNIKNAEIALESLVKPKKNHKDFVKSKINNVLSLVSDYYNISTTDLVSKKRTRNFMYPRQVAMYLIKTTYDLPYKKIGSYFSNRDHSTVMHSVEKITNDIQIDTNVKIDVEKLSIKCGEN